MDFIYLIVGIFVGFIIKKISIKFFIRKWISLTDDEIHECSETPWTPKGLKDIRLIESKLKEKNGF